MRKCCDRHVVVDVTVLGNLEDEDAHEDADDDDNNHNEDNNDAVDDAKWWREVLRDI